MKKVTFNVPLNHKAYSYEPMQIEVEKIIPLYEKRFAQMKNHPLDDCPEIIENRDLMYMEGNTAHCILFLDANGIDGILVEAEGADYARKSQFIPNARAIIEQSEFTYGERQLHAELKGMAGLADFDLLVGGFPCQPFSVAGKRLGTADERGDLFFELARILEAKRPRYFIFENVPGLLGIEKGQTFKVILETLSELGYCVEWLVHDSAGFGVPQSRKRVYLAGCLGIDCSGKILAFGNCNEENSRKVKQLIGGCQGQRVYAPDGLAVTQCSGSGGMGGKTGLYLIDMNYPPTLTEKARCITARQDSGVSKHKGEHSAVFCDLNENPQITENARCLHTRMDIGVGKGSHRGERSGVLVEDGPRAILNPFKEEVYQNGRRVKEPNEPMFTLTVVDRHGIVHQGRIRRLMPIECWRLQGFTTEQFRKVEAAGLWKSLQTTHS